MAENKSEAKPKKPLDIKLIGAILFAVINLGVGGYGVFLVYSSTLGWIPPKLTEDMLKRKKPTEAERKVASVPPAAAGQGAPAPEHGLADLADEIPDQLVYTMDKFTVNLKSESAKSIRLEVSLEMLNKEGFEEVISPRVQAKARDKIIRLLNDKVFSQLEPIQGKLMLKDQIAIEINSLLKDGVVKDVYFSEFVVQ